MSRHCLPSRRSCAGHATPPPPKNENNPLPETTVSRPRYSTVSRPRCQFHIKRCSVANPEHTNTNLGIQLSKTRPIKMGKLTIPGKPVSSTVPDHNKHRLSERSRYIDKLGDLLGDLSIARGTLCHGRARAPPRSPARPRRSRPRRGGV